MRPGRILTIPDTVANTAGGRELVQPGLPGRWSVWSQSDVGPGAHFVVPADETARAVGVKFATVRITEPDGQTARILLLSTDPSSAMPQARRAG